MNDRLNVRHRRALRFVVTAVKANAGAGAIAAATNVRGAISSRQ